MTHIQKPVSIYEFGSSSRRVHVLDASRKIVVAADLDRDSATEIVLALNIYEKLVDLAQEVVAVVGDEYAVDVDLKAYARRLLAEGETE